MPFGRLERRNLPGPMSDINMTPLIDVMLVLLVIFMITAPLMASSLKLDLPSSEGASPTEVPRFISVAIDDSGKWFLGDEAVDAPALRARIAEIASQDPQTEVQLRADKTAPYGQVAALIGEVQLGGLSRIALVAEPAAAAAAD
ncbi:ExbD/TolR family protein [Piscinibacter sakaiensis]|uniref:ExbD/TolR family protein n=1 Tax=Piscinibacter sakaiensis TaxID=1547922 RepID=UPI003AAED8C1